MLKGFKTILVGLGIAILPAAASYIGGVDWSFLGTVPAFIASGIAMIVMRLFTNTSVGSKT